MVKSYLPSINTPLFPSVLETFNGVFVYPNDDVRLIGPQTQQRE